MKEKKTEIATNTSSGAEKVEVVKKQVKTKAENAAKKSAQHAKEVAKKAKDESQKAAARVEKALKKQEEKARKNAEKEQRKREKEKREEERRRARAHARANQMQARAKAKQRKKEEREERRKRAAEKRKQHGQQRENNSGWIAAVVSLGVVTLGLTTAVTLGAMEMNQFNGVANAAYRSATYELVGIMGHVDDDLDRVRIAATPEQQGRILTDLLVQTRLAELDLEKLPMSPEQDSNVTKFINDVGDACERMLSKLRSGEKLSERDIAALERFYEINRTMLEKVETFAEQLSDDDITSFMKKGEGMIADTMQELEKLTMPENGNVMDKMRDMGENLKDKMDEAGDKIQEKMDEWKDKMDGAGMERNQNMPTSENRREPKIDTAQAEKLCQEYFSDYSIEQFDCVGETVCQQFTAYNVQGYDDKGTMLFAEIDNQTGALIRFDYFEDCNQETFDIENAQTVAQQFLQKLGYENMSAMRFRENGTDSDFTFVYTMDDVAFYPDTVRVKVCRTRGVVTAFDASKYIQNHSKRTTPTAKISQETAQERLHDGVEVLSSRLAVVETLRGERTAYEFLCAYGDQKYLIYTDANTGAEISIVNLKNLN